MSMRLLRISWTLLLIRSIVAPHWLRSRPSQRTRRSRRISLPSMSMFSLLTMFIIWFSFLENSMKLLRRVLVLRARDFYYASRMDHADRRTCSSRIRRAFPILSECSEIVEYLHPNSLMKNLYFWRISPNLPLSSFNRVK